MSHVSPLPWTHKTREAARRLPILSNLSLSETGRLFVMSKVLNAPAGAQILHRDRAPKAFTFLIEGKWTMHRYVAGRREPVVREDDPAGSWHGGVSAIDAVAPVNVFTEETSLLLETPISFMLDLCRCNPDVARALLRGIQGGADLLWSSLQNDHSVAV